MNLIYGWSIIIVTTIFSLFLSSITIFAIYKAFVSDSFELSLITLLVQSVIFLLLLLLFVKRGIGIIKNKIPITQPSNPIARLAFIFGGGLLIISVLGIIFT